MESSIAVFLSRQLARELLPTHVRSDRSRGVRDSARHLEFAGFEATVFFEAEMHVCGCPFAEQSREGRESKKILPAQSDFLLKETSQRQTSLSEVPAYRQMHVSRGARLGYAVP